MVVDTSVILAVYFDDPQAAWAAEQLTRHAGQLRMSTVNLTEVLIRLRDRQPTLASDLQQRFVDERHSIHPARRDTGGDGRRSAVAFSAESR